MARGTETIAVITTFREYNKNSQELLAGACRSSRKNTTYTSSIIIWNTLQSVPETRGICE